MRFLYDIRYDKNLWHLCVGIKKRTSFLKLWQISWLIKLQKIYSREKWKKLF